ncbi:hypothetical protein [Corynebacterium afermentans]|uniref:hypothetical protein n=1 Tax=Corynebacterium afermentans TaxID=38286 RepID=UPI002573CEF1|nr:hypothetical protein [Corynebacterium afermentans]MDC7108501.1 hypothetical protein [Corynebacterium afermentans]
MLDCAAATCADSTGNTACVTGTTSANDTAAATIVVPRLREPRERGTETERDVSMGSPLSGPELGRNWSKPAQILKVLPKGEYGESPNHSTARAYFMQIKGAA